MHRPATTMSNFKSFVQRAHTMVEKSHTMPPSSPEPPRVPQKDPLDRRIRLNVGGVRFETWRSTLERWPGTRLSLLAHLMEADESYDRQRAEWFFDRHPGAFASILHFYRTEELHTDHNICGNIIRGELEFWGIIETDIEACCWGNYTRFKEHKDTLAALDGNFTTQFDLAAFGDKPSNLTRFRQRMWRFLEDPTSSRGAKVYAILSMFFVVVSIGVFVLETHSLFRIDKEQNGTIGDSYRNDCYSKMSETVCCKLQSVTRNLHNSEPHSAMTYLDYVCAAYFTVEFVVRLFFAPSKCDFFKAPLNVIDILCLLPHFISIIIKNIGTQNSSAGQIIRVVLALRIIRVLRIFKLMKHYTAFKILVYTIKVSTKELLLMVIFLFTGVLIFASIIYYVENDTFNSIPIGFWWALVTMTTVGYGDKVPASEWGYIIGCGCVLCGVLTVAFTVPIVVNNFTLYYSHAQSRMNLPPKKRRDFEKKLILRNQKASDFIDKITMNLGKKKADFNDLQEVRSPTNSHSPLTCTSSVASNAELTPVAGEDNCVAAKGGNFTEEQVVLRPPGKQRITTVSERVSESSSPTSPTEVRMEEKTPQQRETEELLQGMEENAEKMKAERRRQLAMLHEKREAMMRDRMTPRQTPAPAAAKKK